MKIDVNVPLENPKLKELFARRAALDPKDEKSTISLMNEMAEEIVMNAHFLSVVEYDDANIQTNDNGNVIFGKDTRIGFPNLTGPDGHAYFPAFTNWEELRKWDAVKEGDVKAMILSFDDYYGMVMGSKNGFVIDPFGGNLMLDNATIMQFKEKKDMNTTGHTERIISEKTKVLIGDPAKYPTEMAEAIKAYAATDKRIKAIWLKLMRSGEEESFLLAVDFSGDKDSVFAAIAKAATPYLPKGYFIDMVSCYNTGIGTTAAKGKPLYKKKMFLGLF
ncbi:MAG: enhanced serine sensitivity protein SseB [Firmicutes bacterium]|nr:enhanced serine sensitivity protein SseB [Bacillota bacterium]MBQ9605406.1 enhanced serine sensitivity protein SseB [Bacillota bacterium]